MSPDLHRAAVLATGFSDARLLSPNDAAGLGPARDPDEVLVLPAGAAEAVVIGSLRRQRPRASRILVEVDAADPAALRGLEFAEVVDIAGVSFWSLRQGPNDDVAPDLPASSRLTETRESRPSHQFAEVEALRREVRRLEAELAGRKAPQVASPVESSDSVRSEVDTSETPSPELPAQVRRPPGSRRNVVLAILAVSALVAVLVSVGMAALTGTGYLGGLLTLLAVVVGAGLLALMVLVRRGERAAARRHRAATRAVRHQRERVQRDVRGRIERSRIDSQRDLRSVLARQRDERKRGDRLERQLRLIEATVVESAKRTSGAASRSTNVLADPARLAEMHQTQALLNLFALGPVRGVVPPMGGWAASPDVVAVLVQEMLTRRPSLVVECGSGVSTLWLALVAEWYALPTRIVALDHDEHFAAQTRRTLIEHNVAHRAEIRYAPLAPAGLAGHETPWYDRSVVADLQDVGLLFVDGPTETTGPLVRWPAVPVMEGRLAPRATIILDDLIRASEQEVTARWAVALSDFVLERLPLQKGAARFRRG